MRSGDLVNYLQNGAGEVPGDQFSGLQQGNTPVEAGGLPPPNANSPMMPPPPMGGGPTNDPLNNSTGPRELHPASPTTPDVSRRGAGGPAPEQPDVQGTPGRPSAPTPVAGMPPVPFTPLAPTDPQLLTQPQVGRPDLPNTPMFGSAGGALGGGMGVPGAMSTTASDNPDISQLLQMLMGKQ